MDTLQTLIAAGLTLIADGRSLIASPATVLTPELRELIRQRKPELMSALSQRAALAASINRTCDLRGDDDANRAGLLAECGALSLSEQAEMLEHFDEQARMWAAACGIAPDPRDDFP